MKNIVSILLLVISLSAASVQAEEQSNRESIERLFSVMEMDKQMTGGFEAILPVVGQMAAQMNLNAEEESELLSIYRDWFDQDIDRESIKTQMIELYAEAFSQQEVEEVIEFYQTPAGQSFLKKSPELMKLGAQIGMKEGQSKQQKLIDRLTPFMEKHKK